MGPEVPAETDAVLGVTEADLIAALEEALASAAPDATGALTTAQLMAASGKGIDSVRKALIGLKAAGRLEVVRVAMIDLAGRQTTVPGYRVVKA